MDEISESERDLAKFFEDHMEDQLGGTVTGTPALITKCKDIIAFLLLDKLVPGHVRMLAAADHDIVFLSVDPHKVNEVATNDELLTLIRCGVLFDAEQEAFFMFV